MEEDEGDEERKGEKCCGMKQKRWEKLSVWKWRGKGRLAGCQWNLRGGGSEYRVVVVVVVVGSTRIGPGKGKGKGMGMGMGMVARNLVAQQGKGLEDQWDHWDGSQVRDQRR